VVCTHTSAIIPVLGGLAVFIRRFGPEELSNDHGEQNHPNEEGNKLRWGLGVAGVGDVVPCNCELDGSDDYGRDDKIAGRLQVLEVTFSFLAVSELAVWSHRGGIKVGRGLVPYVLKPSASPPSPCSSRGSSLG